MSHYVDGYVIPIPKKNLQAYVKMARKGCRLWMKYGALDYYECVGEDLAVPFGRSFTKGLKLKKGETAVFAFIVFKSRTHRDRVNKRVMADPELMAGFDPKKPPFDPKRMLYGGFASLVHA